MGQVLRQLAKRELGKPLFPSRMVIELCEKAHFHYRNLRIIQPLDEFINMAEGFVQSLNRWKQRGCPGTGNKHIELCRKKVSVADSSNVIEINLNKNLYAENEGKIFAEGVEFGEPVYVHVKLRDLRIELSISEFEDIAETFQKAKENLSVAVAS